MRRQLDSLPDRVDDPTEEDLASGPGTVSLHHLLEGEGLTSLVLADVRSGEYLVNGVEEVPPQCPHASGTALAELDEVVNKDVSGSQRLGGWTVGRRGYLVGASRGGGAG